MNLRSINERKRDLKKDSSLWNPIFLQLSFAIGSVKKYFESLPRDIKLKIYDFGCGQKPYQVFVHDHDYIGIDIDEKNTSADIHANIENVPVNDKEADVVVSFYVLEHVQNPQKVIDEKFRILKEGGRLFMLVPLYWEEHEQPYDFFRFTRFGIEMLMKNAGFKEIVIEEVNTNFSILGMHLARLFAGRKFLYFFVPIINYVFLRLEIRTKSRAIKLNKTLSNVMTFAVKGTK
ncbi:MAG: class I SAM-dependent methyltransferase [Methylobacter sp.]|nr:class I SAM-dependent methyltransferase [Methylobacter sp.]